MTSFRVVIVVPLQLGIIGSDHGKQNSPCIYTRVGHISLILSRPCRGGNLGHLVVIYFNIVMLHVDRSEVTPQKTLIQNSSEDHKFKRNYYEISSPYKGSAFSDILMQQ